MYTRDVSTVPINWRWHSVALETDFKVASSFTKIIYNTLPTHVMSVIHYTWFETNNILVNFYHNMIINWLKTKEKYICSNLLVCRL